MRHDARKKYPAVTFYDGVLAERDLLILCGKPDHLEYDDYSQGCTLSFSKNIWGGVDHPFMTNAVCVYYPPDAAPAPRAMCTLAQKAGCVDFYWSQGGKANVEKLPVAEKKGGLVNLHKITQIGDDLYVVGSGSQVFRRARGTWQVFNQGLERLPPEFFLDQGKSLSQAVSLSMDSAAMLHSIDGAGPQALYAVGYGGLVCFRGQGDWQRLEQVTNANLHSIKYVDATTVYAAGDRGILLKGNSRGFDVVPTGIDDDIWGLEWFKGKLYLGTVKSGLFVWDGQRISKVATTPKADFECHTLNARDGQLLALGSKDIFLTDDGISWRVLLHPDNQ